MSRHLPRLRVNEFLELDQYNKSKEIAVQPVLLMRKMLVPFLSKL